MELVHSNYLRVSLVKKLKMREKETEKKEGNGAGREGEAGRKKEGFLEIHTTNPKGNDMNL